MAHLSSPPTATEKAALLLQLHDCAQTLALLMMQCSPDADTPSLERMAQELISARESVNAVHMYCEARINWRVEGHGFDFDTNDGAH